MGLVVGLTGGIASGKSTIAKMIKDQGFTVIDADVEARVAVEIGMPAYKKIVEYFGEGILQQDGTIDRAKLGAIVFNNKDKREKLNEFVHPEVRKQMLKKKEEAIRKNEKLIVLDIPLLFESKLTDLVDKILLVYVDGETQLKRLMERNGYTKEEAAARIRSQMPLSEKLNLSDAVINNNGTIEESKKQLIEILKEWKILKEG